MVSAGTIVDFRNHDQVFHMPFSVSPAGAFELGRCAPGSAHGATFDHAGVVEVYCALHPTEAMYVIVSPERWHAHPTADGSFRFDDLPLGTYLVHAWNAAQGDVAKRVEVTSAAPVSVTFDR